MKRISKLAMGLVLLVALAFGNVMTVQAEGTTTLYLSTNDPIGVGDTVSVRIKGTDSSTVTVKYTASVLTFVSCTNDSYKTDSNSVIFTGSEATIKFSGATEGTANVIVTSDALVGSSAQVVVSGGGSAAPAEQTQEETPEEQPQEETTPEAPVEGAVVTGEAISAITVTTPENLLTPNFVETSFVTEDGTTVPAYRLQNTESDFYYVYGCTEDGNYAWFSYDAANHSLQRADTTLFTMSASSDTVSANDGQSTENGEDSLSIKERAMKLYKYRRFFLILVFIVLIVLIVLFNRYLKKRDEEYDDEDEDDFFSEYGEAQETRDARESRAESRETRASKRAREEEDDFDWGSVTVTSEKQTEEVEEKPAVKKPEVKKPVVHEVADDIDLSDAIVNQVMKPAKHEDDDLKIIDFNDL